MLITAINRYLSLRQTLGFKLRDTARFLRAFGRYAEARGDTHVRADTALEWAETAPTPHSRHIHLRDVVKLARFLAAEDAGHEVPKLDTLRSAFVRPLPYIYSPEEISRIVAAASRLRIARGYPLRRSAYATLLGLIACTGLRVSEALNLRFKDVGPDGVLQIRLTKFGKSRIVPLHPTATAALERYRARRRAVVVPDDHLFLSASNERIAASTVNYTFLRILKLAGITPDRARTPRIHDLRHTFATRALEKCPTERKAVARHFVALSTYLGHVDIKQTYWYLQATPELMTDIAAAAELLAGGGAR
jgi:integrase